MGLWPDCSHESLPTYIVEPFGRPRKLSRHTPYEPTHGRCARYDSKWDNQKQCLLRLGPKPSPAPGATEELKPYDRRRCNCADFVTTKPPQKILGEIIFHTDAAFQVGAISRLRLNAGP